VDFADVAIKFMLCGSNVEAGQPFKKPLDPISVLDKSRGLLR
jgi:hypothetical protein